MFKRLVLLVAVLIILSGSAVYAADAHFSVDHPKQLDLYSLWGDVYLSKLQIYELNSIWYEKKE